jgi:UV DNA damage repair endonuclease
MSNLGYACINMTLGKKKITTNRSMIKKTFLKEGIDRASELGLQNTLAPLMCLFHPMKRWF